MKLNANKILICLILFVLLFFTYSIKSFAVSDMIEQADEFMGKGKKVEDVIRIKNLEETSNKFYTAFSIVGIVLAVVVGVCIGVKYIFESVEGQAKLKEAFVPYLVGCVVIFSAFSTWKMIINFGNENNFLTEDYVSLEQVQPTYLDVYDKITNKNESWDEISDEDLKASWAYYKIKNGKTDDINALVFAFEKGDNTLGPWAYVYYVMRIRK